MFSVSQNRRRLLLILLCFVCCGAVGVFWGLSSNTSDIVATETTTKATSSSVQNTPSPVRTAEPHEEDAAAAETPAPPPVDPVAVERAMSVLGRYQPGTYADHECACKPECFDQGDRDAELLGDINTWAPLQLDRLLDSMFAPWEKVVADSSRQNVTAASSTPKLRGKISLYHTLQMVSCRFGNKYGSNPSGLWIHISGRNITLLRHMIDGYGRSQKILEYIRRLVRAARRPYPPMAFYISVTDHHCHPFLPFLTFFRQASNVFGLLIPDDTHVGTHVAKSWEEQRVAFLNHSSHTPWRSRSNKAFFRGSPTHALREEFRRDLEKNPMADIKLAVLEKFKSLQVPLKDHVQYRYLFAIRGRSASSRDKYLNTLGSTILWGREDEVNATAAASAQQKRPARARQKFADTNGYELEDVDTVKRYRPWMQFYHTLWQPFVNFVPIRPSTAECTLSLLGNNNKTAAAAERIAKRAEEIGRWMTQERVDDYFDKVLRRYARAQAYVPDSDPVKYLRACNSLAKRRFNRVNDLVADHPYNFKWSFGRWLRRRVRQIEACRDPKSYTWHDNGTKTLKLEARFNVRARQSGCWYL